MARFSSAVKGLIPKSTGGRMALGAGGALGVAAGVAGYRKHQRTNMINSMSDDQINGLYAKNVVLPGILDGSLPVPRGTAQVTYGGNTYQVPQR